MYVNTFVFPAFTYQLSGLACLSATQSRNSIICQNTFITPILDPDIQGYKTFHIALKKNESFDMRKNSGASFKTKTFINAVNVHLSLTKKLFSIKGVKL